MLGGDAHAQDEQAELDRVRQAIEALERRISGQQSEMEAGVQALRAVELEIASAQARLTDLRGQQRERRRELERLHADARAADQRLGQERTTLGRQVLLSYMLGREELLKLVLNQESPTALGRMVVYYDYLNKARGERIAVVSAELRRLEAVAAAVSETETELVRLTAATEREIAGLEASRDKRSRVVTELDAALATSGRELDSLRESERRLTELVNELDDILEAFPKGAAEPFATLKGRLAWPVPGPVVESYGQLRNGGPLRWNGVVVDAERGTPVRAVYYGRVAFSDWLPGLGLLLIIDHGDRYLSLYGYNEVLLKESGEWVEPGDVVAQVGDTSGRIGAALYFELRYRGEPVDPLVWMRESR